MQKRHKVKVVTAIVKFRNSCVKKHGSVEDAEIYIEPALLMSGDWEVTKQTASAFCLIDQGVSLDRTTFQQAFDIVIQVGDRTKTMSEKQVATSNTTTDSDRSGYCGGRSRVVSVPV